MVGFFSIRFRTVGFDTVPFSGLLLAEKRMDVERIHLGLWFNSLYCLVVGWEQAGR